MRAEVRIDQDGKSCERMMFCTIEMEKLRKFESSKVHASDKVHCPDNNSSGATLLKTIPACCLL